MGKVTTAIGLFTMVTFTNTGFATDYSEGIHENDYKWFQFNLMYALKELPRKPDSHSGHDYLEMEFGGRSGIFDLYGYVDVFDLTNFSASDKNGDSKMFMKFAPRVSLNALFGSDLSFGPVQEIYFSTLFNWGGGGGDNDPNNSFWGLGADIMVPWLGKTGLNLYGLYDVSKKAWNGYQVSLNWFKPLYTFGNGSFISYQGYIDYQFGAKDTFKNSPQATNGGVMFNGLYWHSDHYSMGYGFKAYQDVYLIKDSKGFESSGVAHYFSVTYKF